MSELDKSTKPVSDEVLEYALKARLETQEAAYKAQAQFDALVEKRWGHHYSENRSGLEGLDVNSETRSNMYKLGMGLEDDHLVEAIDYWNGEGVAITIEEFIAGMNNLTKNNRNADVE